MTPSDSNTTLRSTYVHLRADDSASLVEVTPTFWQELTSSERPELEAGRLVTLFDFESDWSTWEMHPAGDELVVLVSGEVELVLDRDGAEHTNRLTTPGEFVLVPRGTWHTARTRSRTTMLFVTPGEGTQHRPA